MTRGRWALVLLVLVLAACGPTPIASPPAVTSPPAVASPGPVAGATVLIRLDACPLSCVDPRRIQYWSDGTVIRLDAGAERLVVRRLTKTGLATVTARIERDRDLLVTEMRADAVLVPGGRRHRMPASTRIRFIRRHHLASSCASVPSGQGRSIPLCGTPRHRSTG